MGIHLKSASFFLLLLPIWWGCKKPGNPEIEVSTNNRPEVIAPEMNIKGQEIVQRCIEAYDKVLTLDADIKLTGISFYANCMHQIRLSGKITYEAPDRLQLTYTDTNNDTIELVCSGDKCLERSPYGPSKGTIRDVLSEHHGASSGISTFLPAILLDVVWPEPIYGRTTDILESLRESARFVESEHVNGRPCSKVQSELSVKGKKSVRITLWIDEETDLICRFVEDDENGGGFTGKIKRTKTDTLIANSALKSRKS